MKIDGFARLLLLPCVLYVHRLIMVAVVAIYIPSSKFGFFFVLLLLFFAYC